MEFKMKTIPLLLILLISSCSKFKVPEFSNPTIAINKSNADLIIEAYTYRAAARFNIQEWYSDYGTDYPTSIVETYTSYCDSGGEIFGDIQDEIIRSDRNYIEADIKYTNCNFANSVTIVGDIYLEGTYYLSNYDHYFTNEGNFEVSTNIAKFKYTQHFAEFDYVESPFELKAQEYAKIEISQYNSSIGTVNYYTDIQRQETEANTEGTDIIEGKDGTAIKVVYSNNAIKYYLDNSLYYESTL